MSECSWVRLCKNNQIRCVSRPKWRAGVGGEIISRLNLHHETRKRANKEVNTTRIKLRYSGGVMGKGSHREGAGESNEMMGKVATEKEQERS